MPLKENQSLQITHHLHPDWLNVSFFVFLQASTPYSLESDNLGMDCIISGSASPTLAINTVTNKVAFHFHLHKPWLFVPSQLALAAYIPSLHLYLSCYDYVDGLHNMTDMWCFCLHRHSENWHWVSSILGRHYVYKSS